MGAPTLSQIESWDTEHLESAARSWNATAEHWEDTFTAVHRGSLNPGGTVWEGEGAEAAQQRTFADLVKVRGFTDHLYKAATVARRGADELDYLKRMALYAVDDARGAGFDVAEDLSVSDRSLVPLGPAFAVRQAQAQALAAEIGIRAAALTAADHEIAAEITAATAPLSGVAFEEASPEEKSGVQLVDYKKSPPTPSPPSPDVANTVDDMLDGQDLSPAEREQLRQILTQKLDAATAQGLSPDQGYADAENAATTYMANLHRSYVRKASRLDAWREAERTPNGDILSDNTADRIPVLRNANGDPIWVDKNTGREVGTGPQGPPDSMTVPEKGQSHLGHQYGEENWRVLKQAEEEGWTQKELNDFMNQRGRYRVETPAENHGHGYEDKSAYHPNPDWTPERITAERAAAGASSGQAPAGGAPVSAPMDGPVIGPIVTIPPDMLKAAGGAVAVLGGIAAFLVHPFSPVE